MVNYSRTHQYYQHKQPAKDWHTKQLVEATLRIHPSYGHRRIATHLGINKKRVLRIMRLFGIKPARRVTKKTYKRPKDSVYPNLLLTESPRGSNDIWVSDFTHIVKFEGKWVYLATVLDMYSREVVGYSILTNHSTQLVMNAFLNAIQHHPPPRIIHSDQGSEYASADYTTLVRSRNTLISMSHPGCPWENGYQESFYSRLKVEFGDPTRFESLGELVAALYEAIHYYNTSRIHTSLGMPPRSFVNQNQL